MGALSPMHMVMVLVIALLVFGPKKLPEIGKELGKALREFKRASRDVMDSFHDALEDRPHPVSTYDPPYLSAYHPPEDTFHQAAQASSLGEPAAVETPAALTAAPAGTVERPPHSPAAPAAAEASAPTTGAAPAASAPVEPARDPAKTSERTA
jgi:sec-independent protein translocase protein TatA